MNIKNKNRIVIDDLFFSDVQKNILHESFTDLFRNLDEEYSSYTEKKSVYFNEVTIFVRANIGNFSLVFHSPDRDADIGEVSFSQIEALLESLSELHSEKSLIVFEFIKDQEGADFDYVAKISTLRGDIYILE